VEYRLEDHPGATAGLARLVVLPWNERYQDAHVDRIFRAIRTCVADLAGRRSR
jgi:hypothetical protein